MKKAIRPVILVFVIVNALAIVFAKRLEAKGIDSQLVIGGNIVICLATLLSFWMHYKAINTRSTTGIIKNVYGGFMAKFFILLIAAFAYIFLAKEVNKYGLFICMGLYFVYTFAGTRNVLKQQPKTNTDGEGKTTV